MTEKKINAPYDNPFGIWHVTTEGDCEGHSPRDLGFHEGYIDEIALALADKCFYSLYFVAINIHSLDITPTRKTVDVTFGVNSGTWAMTPKECVTAIKDVMKDRPIQVEQSCRTGAVVFTTETKTKEEKRQEVLAKLSPEERQILGLEEPKQ